MIGLATLCLAGSLGLALLLLLAAGALGWRRRRIRMLVRPWLLAVLILLTIGLAAEARGGIGGLGGAGWLLGGTWLAVSLAAHLFGRGGNDPARVWGARISHAGVGIAVVGLMLSAIFSSRMQRALAPGETMRVSSWTVQLHEVWPAAGAGWAGVSAELRASSGNGVVILRPERRTSFAGASRAHDAALDTGTSDLVSRLGPRAADGRWPIEVRSTPLLALIPIGLAIAAVGGAFALAGPSVRRSRRLRRARLATAWWA